MDQLNADLTTNKSPNLMGKPDVAEVFFRRIDESVKEQTGTSLFHILTIGSIVTSIALFVSGRRSTGIFIGLWAPTFQGLKAASDRNADR